MGFLPSHTPHYSNPETAVVDFIFNCKNPDYTPENCPKNKEYKKLRLRQLRTDAAQEFSVLFYMQ